MLWKKIVFFLDAYKMERKGEISATIIACTVVQFCPAGCKLLKQGGMNSLAVGRQVSRCCCLSCWLELFLLLVLPPH